MRGGNVVLLVERLGALPVLLRALAFGSRRFDGGTRFLDFLRARAGFEFPQPGARLAQIRAALIEVARLALLGPLDDRGSLGELGLRLRQRRHLALALAEQLLPVETRHHHAGLDNVTFIDGALYEAARDLEGNIDLCQLDIAGDANPVVRLRAKAANGKRAGDPNRRKRQDDDDFLCHKNYWRNRRRAPVACPRSIRA